MHNDFVISEYQLQQMIGSKYFTTANSNTRKTVVESQGSVKGSKSSSIVSSSNSIKLLPTLRKHKLLGHQQTQGALTGTGDTATHVTSKFKSSTIHNPSAMYTTKKDSVYESQVLFKKIPFQTEEESNPDQYGSSPFFDTQKFTKHVRARQKELNTFKKMQKKWQELQEQAQTIIKQTNTRTEQSQDHHSPTNKKELVLRMVQGIQSCLVTVDYVLQNSFEKVAADRHWNHLRGSLQVLKMLSIKDLYLALLLIKAKAHVDNGDVYEAITIFKECKHLAHRVGNFRSKMKVYKHLGQCYMQIQQYQPSLSCFLKMINLSWYLRDMNYELIAYDKLSLCFFYLGNMTMSTVLHDRLNEAKLEPDNTQPKLYGVAKVKAKMKQKWDEHDNQYIKQQKTVEEQILSESSSEQEDHYMKELVARENMGKEVVFTRERTKNKAKCCYTKLDKVRL